MKTFRCAVRPKVPPGYVVIWLNVYSHPSKDLGDGYIQAGGAYPTRKMADAVAKPWRLDCVPALVPCK